MKKETSQLCLFSLLCLFLLSPVRSIVSSTLTNFKGQYKTDVQVGFDNTLFSVVLDISSSKFWLPDSATTASVPEKFDCSKSRSCQSNTSDVRTLLYPAGSVTGYSATDKMILQGATIPQFKFLLAKDIAADLASFDGMLGLGFNNSGQTDPTFLDTLKSNKLIKEAVFSLYLADSDTSSDSSVAGDITFGGYKTNYIENKFQFVDLLDNPNTPYWTLSLAGIGYGSDKNISDVPNIPVRIDIGSNVMALPNSFIQNFLETSRLNLKFDDQNQQYSGSCDTLPDLILYFNGVRVNISSSSYFTRGSSNSNFCYLSMKNLSKDASLAEPAVIGSAILKDYYTLFSAEKNTIGFALLKKGSPISMLAVFGLVFLGVVIIAAIVYYCTKQKGAQAGEGANAGYTTIASSGRGVAIGGSSNNTRPPYARYNDENQSV